MAEAQLAYQIIGNAYQRFLSFLPSSLIKLLNYFWGLSTGSPTFPLCLAMDFEELTKIIAEAYQTYNFIFSYIKKCRCFGYQIIAEAYLLPPFVLCSNFDKLTKFFAYNISEPYYQIAAPYECTPHI